MIIIDLPTELIVKIVDFTNDETIKTLMNVSVKFYQIITSFIWNHHTVLNKYNSCLSHKIKFDTVVLDYEIVKIQQLYFLKQLCYVKTVVLKYIDLLYDIIPNEIFTHLNSIGCKSIVIGDYNLTDDQISQLPEMFCYYIEDYDSHERFKLLNGAVSGIYNKKSHKEIFQNSLSYKYTKLIKKYVSISDYISYRDSWHNVEFHIEQLFFSTNSYGIPSLTYQTDDNREFISIPIHDNNHDLTNFIEKIDTIANENLAKLRDTHEHNETDITNNKIFDVKNINRNKVHELKKISKTNKIVKNSYSKSKYKLCHR